LSVRYITPVHCAGKACVRWQRFRRLAILADHRQTALRHLPEMVKSGYVERLGNAKRVDASLLMKMENE
jgi:hypothetical protein